MIKGLMLDLDGTLYVGREPVAGAREAVEALGASGFALRYVTNTTRMPRRVVVERMRTLGFLVEEDEVFTPAWAASRLIGGRSCLALVDESLHEDLGRARLTEDSPEVVLVGDLGEGFTYARLDAAFRCLMEGAELVALQKNRYWQNEGGLSRCRAIRRCARVCEREKGRRRRQAGGELLQDRPGRYGARSQRSCHGRRRCRGRRRRREESRALGYTGQNRKMAAWWRCGGGGSRTR